MNQREQIARIERMQEETREFVAETHKPDLAPWPFALGGMIVGAVLFGAGMAFVRLLGA